MQTIHRRTTCLVKVGSFIVHGFIMDMFRILGMRDDRVQCDPC